MSTQYDLNGNLNAVESSSRVQLTIDDNYERNFSYDMDAAELRKVIVKLVHVLSYISDDPEAALKRFNVDYGDKE